MKTTMEIEDTLFKRAKSDAAKKGITLKQWVEDAMRARLLNSNKMQKSGYVFQPLIVSGVSPPRVDIADRNVLYDFMERE